MYFLKLYDMTVLNYFFTTAEMRYSVKTVFLRYQPPSLKLLNFNTVISQRVDKVTFSILFGNNIFCGS